MARSIWKGSIAFGLVNIPVSLTSAESRPDIQLHMVDSTNHARIRYERVNAETGEEVPWDRMVKAYEYEDGEFILLSEEELASVRPEFTKTIEITEFVSLEEIDPILFEKPYYLEPDKRGRRAYALLREALRHTGKAGISKVVIRTREYLAAVFPKEQALVLMLLRFPQEIRSSSRLDLPSPSEKESQPAKKEMDLAQRLIAEMTVTWDPDAHHDEYRATLMDYIEKKIASGDVVEDIVDRDRDDAGDSGGKVLDLAEYLQRSIKRPPGPAAKKTAKHARKATAKKAARKKGRRSA